MRGLFAFSVGYLPCSGLFAYSGLLALGGLFALRLCGLSALDTVWFVSFVCLFCQLFELGPFV